MVSVHQARHVWCSPSGAAWRVFLKRQQSAALVGEPTLHTVAARGTFPTHRKPALTFRSKSADLIHEQILHTPCGVLSDAPPLSFELAVFNRFRAVSLE